MAILLSISRNKGLLKKYANVNGGLYGWIDINDESRLDNEDIQS